MRIENISLSADSLLLQVVFYKVCELQKYYILYSICKSIEISWYRNIVYSNIVYGNIVYSNISKTSFVSLFKIVFNFIKMMKENAVTKLIFSTRKIFLKYNSSKKNFKYLVLSLKGRIREQLWWTRKFNYQSMSTIFHGYQIFLKTIFKRPDSCFKFLLKRLAFFWARKMFSFGADFLPARKLKLRLFIRTEFLVWKLKVLRHPVAKI